MGLKYLNPGGHNWGPINNDIYGISTFAVGGIYTIVFWLACLFMWLKRHHPALRMRKMSLAILSILILHVYLLMIFMAYFLNGLYPCKVEFWTMSIYLPIGIGLFQAQNQQLLLLSKGQDELLHHQDRFKPLLPKSEVVGRSRYCLLRLQAWWDSTSKQGKFEGFVFMGICVQVGESKAHPTFQSDSLSSVRRFSGSLLLVPQVQCQWSHLAPCYCRPMPARLGVASTLHRL